MNFHIAAKPGEIADGIIISGDPQRTRFMAEKLLEKVICFNEIRGMYGYTGFYQGKRISMMGTGIGIPSTMLYLHELINDHGIRRVIRAGTLGAFTPQLSVGDLVVAMSASNDNTANQITFKGLQYAATADFELLKSAVNAARNGKTTCHVGQIFSTDRFYSDEPNRWDKWIEHGILGVEMETSAIYTMAAKYKVQALSLLTVSDNIATRQSASPKERETQYDAMFKLAAEII